MRDFFAFSHCFNEGERQKHPNERTPRGNSTVVFLFALKERERNGKDVKGSHPPISHWPCVCVNARAKMRSLTHGFDPAIQK